MKLFLLFAGYTKQKKKKNPENGKKSHDEIAYLSLTKESRRHNNWLFGDKNITVSRQRTEISS